MIRSFRHRGLKQFYTLGKADRLPPACIPRLEAVLTALDVATSVASLRLPGLHPLKGDRKGYWSVVISGNWRVVFRFSESDVHDVDFLDYH